MKPHAFQLAAVCLAACAATAQAEPVTVSAGGTINLAGFGTGPTAATMQFTMDSVVVNPSLQPDAFVVHDLAVQFTYGNVTKSITQDEMIWFDYNNGQYAGIDFRLHDVLIQGDMLQFIWSPGLRASTWWPPTSRPPVTGAPPCSVRVLACGRS
jgi:hypothetical protein